MIVECIQYRWYRDSRVGCTEYREPWSTTIQQSIWTNQNAKKMGIKKRKKRRHCIGHSGERLESSITSNGMGNFARLGCATSAADGDGDRGCVDVRERDASMWVGEGTIAICTDNRWAHIQGLDERRRCGRRRAARGLAPLEDGPVERRRRWGRW